MSLPRVARDVVTQARNSARKGGEVHEVYAGESVALLVDDEPIKDFQGKNDR